MTTDSFSRRQLGCIIAIAVVGGCIPSLQPLLLSSMLDAGKLSASQIGQAAMWEGLGMAVSALIAGAILKPLRLQRIILFAALIALLANIGTILFGALGIQLCRALNGMASGILLWLVVGLIIRVPSPARTFAVYVTAQSVCALLLSLLFSSLIIPRSGANGSYLVLAALNLLLLIPVLGIPRAYTLLASQQRMLRPSVVGVLGLMVLLLFLAGVMGFWVYVIPIGVELGLDQQSLSYGISLAIAVQILAGFAAAVFANRLNGSLVTTVSGLLCALLVFMAPQVDTVSRYFLIIMLFAFLWMFAPPFHMPFMLRLDSSGQSAMFLSGAQLLGVSLGPLIAAWSVKGGDFSAAALSSMGLFFTSGLLGLLVIGYTRTRLQGNAVI